MTAWTRGAQRNPRNEPQNTPPTCRFAHRFGRGSAVIELHQVGREFRVGEETVLSRILDLVEAESQQGEVPDRMGCRR